MGFLTSPGFNCPHWPHEAHVTSLFYNLNCLTLEKRVHLKILLLTFKGFGVLNLLYLQELSEVYAPNHNLTPVIDFCMHAFWLA